MGGMTPSPERKRLLSTVAVVCTVIFVADIVILNVVGEVSSAWWMLAVPVGLVLVPIIGLVSLVLLVLDSRRA